MLVLPEIEGEEACGESDENTPGIPALPTGKDGPCADRI